MAENRQWSPDFSRKQVQMVRYNWCVSARYVANDQQKHMHMYGSGSSGSGY